MLSRRNLLAGFGALATLSLAEPLTAIPANATPKGYRVVSGLPSSMSGKIAWTVDDGYNNESVSGYLKVAQETGLKFTFFMNSAYGSWFRHTETIKDLLATGQIQLGNHTHSHADLTAISEKKVRQQLLGCHERMLDHFGYDARPYWRPPYGSTNAKVRDIAAELGYTTEVLWLGGLADSFKTNPNAVTRNAERWFRSRRIVIAHANSPVAIQHFDSINALLQARGLETVTIREAFD